VDEVAVGVEGDVGEEELQPLMVQIKTTDRVAVRVVIGPPVLNALDGGKRAKTRRPRPRQRDGPGPETPATGVRQGPLPAKIPPGCGNPPCAAHSFA
jgi:hypothetical protein